MAQGKQAKTLTDAQIARMLREVENSRYPIRDRVMVLLSVRAGLRAKEIALATWGMVLDADGNVGDTLELYDKASKGSKSGREIPLHPELRSALVALLAAPSSSGAALLANGASVSPETRICHSERELGLAPGSVQIFFQRLYQRLGLKGASSHSGRRTFVTSLAKKIVAAGGSLRDVQQLAGHASLSTTQRYIEGSSDAKRRAIGML
jgi:integrase/recombinase XerC